MNLFPRSLHFVMGLLALTIFGVRRLRNDKIIRHNSLALELLSQDGSSGASHAVRYMQVEFGKASLPIAHTYNIHGSRLAVDKVCMKNEFKVFVF